MAARGFTIALGVVLLGFGLWGMATGGEDHRLIVFGVNAGHNLLHVLSGVLALLAALAGERQAQACCLVIGTGYGALAVGGFFQLGALVKTLNLNPADDFLHLAIAVACLWVGGTAKTATS